MNAVKTFLYMGSLHGLFTYYLPWQLASHDPWRFNLGLFRWLAFPFWLTGTLIILRCSVDIVRRGHGTPAHLDPPKQLIVTGPYQHVRNPIYLGALLALLGHLCWSGSGWVIAYFVCYAIALHVLIVFFEEPVLRKMFGKTYDEYRSEVPRWLPKLR